MKKALFLSAAMLLVAGFAGADIGSSSHDFSGATWNSGGEICVVCHAPHNPSDFAVDKPLWNHAATEATFSLYSSTTLRQTPVQPGGASKTCLSCHDGTVALDSFGGSTGSTMISGSALIGINLTDDHPVGITYTTATAAAQDLNDPAGITLGGIAPYLPGNNVECATCHDVHNQFSQTALLLESNAVSALCLKCHAK